MRMGRAAKLFFCEENFLHVTMRVTNGMEQW